MKKVLLFLILLISVNVATFAQKFALIDMDYILKNIPAYQQSKTELDTQSKQWHSSIQKLQDEVKQMYVDYQKDQSKLTAAQKSDRENAIVKKEADIQKQSDSYFGPKGQLSQKEEAIIKPIEDAVYTAVKELSAEQGYSLVIDRASARSVIFASPQIDISNEVLAKMGYSK